MRDFFFTQKITDSCKTFCEFESTENSLVFLSAYRQFRRVERTNFCNCGERTNFAPFLDQLGMGGYNRIEVTRLYLSISP